MIDPAQERRGPGRPRKRPLDQKEQVPTLVRIAEALERIAEAQQDMLHLLNECTGDPYRRIEARRYLRIRDQGG